MGSKLILLLGLIVGALLTFFCVNENKHEHLFNYQKDHKKLLNIDAPELKQIETKSIVPKEPVVKEPIATDKIEDNIEEKNSTLIDMNREEIEKKEHKKLKDIEAKITKLLTDNPIYFKTNSSAIKEDSKKSLNMIAEALKDISDKTIVLVKGHTDASGEASQNKKLSQKRADSVMLYLKKGGLDSLNMKAIGYGEGQPIVVSNPNDKLNRRVEIELKRGE